MRVLARTDCAFGVSSPDNTGTERIAAWLDVNAYAKRLSFFFAAHNDLFCASGAWVRYVPRYLGESIGARGRSRAQELRRRLRIRIPTANVPQLYKDTGAEIYSIPDLRRYDWPVTAIYSRDLRPADDSMFVALGGRVTARLLAIRMVGGILPDRSVPSLGQQPDVIGIAEGRVFCNVAA